MPRLASDPGRIDAMADSSGGNVTRAKVDVPERGYFSRPAICVNPPADSPAVTGEAFGPLATIRGHGEIDDVLNATRTDNYGLGGYVIGEPLRAAKVAQALDVGIIGVDDATPNTPLVPFGGVKHSGLGSEGGVAGLDVFLTQHTTAVAG